jgi:hypothetical protein
VTGSSPYRRTVVTEDGPAGDEPQQDAPEPLDGAQGDEHGRDPVSAIGAGLAAASGSSSGSRATRGRPATLAVRKDIRAKVGFMLTLPGGMWSMSDPLCGGQFLADAPAVADALVDIICDSPDLVAWFTSGGNYMKWLTLVTALQGTGVTLWRHHIAHSVGDEHEQRDSFDPRRYPAVVPNSAAG